MKSNNKIILYISLIILIYFTYQTYIYYYPSNFFENFTQFSIELFIIPSILVTLMCFGYSLVQIIKKKEDKVNFAILAINIVIIVLISVITFN